MQILISLLIAASFLSLLVSWIWLIILGFKYGGTRTALLFFLLGAFALFWAARKAKEDPSSDARKPLILGGSGAVLLFITVIAHSFLVS
jgi:peptidoglycan/LPS O-acetylase OafA/YrhL